MGTDILDCCVRAGLGQGFCFQLGKGFKFLSFFSKNCGYATRALCWPESTRKTIPGENSCSLKSQECGVYVSVFLHVPHDHVCLFTCVSCLDTCMSLCVSTVLHAGRLSREGPYLVPCL